MNHVTLQHKVLSKFHVIYMSVAWWEQILFLNMNGEAGLEALMREEELPIIKVL